MSTPPPDQPPYGPYVPPSGAGPYDPTPVAGSGRYVPPPPYDDRQGSSPAAGRPYGPPPEDPGYRGDPDEDRPLDVVSVVGLVLGVTFVLAPLGLVLSVVGLFRTAGSRRRGRGLAIAGVVVSAVMTLLLGLVVAALVAFGTFVSTTVGELDQTQLEQFQEDLENMDGLENMEGLEGLGPRVGVVA